MGMLAVVLVHLDALQEIEDNKQEAIDGIVDALRTVEEGPTTVHVGHSVNYIHVFPAHHSSDTVLYFMSGNTLIELTPERMRDSDWIRKSFEERADWLLSKET